MAKTSRPRAEEETSKAGPSALALLANGSSGRWSVTLDESTEGTEEWFLQMEGPSVQFFCEIDDPQVLHTLATFLESPGKKPDVLVLGRVERIPLRLRWDVEDDDKRLLFTVGPASRPLVRSSIAGPDIRDLRAALQQAILDLE